MKKRPRIQAKQAGNGIGLSWSTVLNVIILLLALYVFLPQFGRFQNSTQALTRADPGLVLLGGVLALVTCLFAAGTYQVLAKKRLVYNKTLGVQVAGLFANRLLPAGLGGISLNIRYLMKSRHSASEAAAVAAANNLLGFLAHSLLLLLALLVARRSLFGTVSVAIPQQIIFMLPLIIVVVIAILWAFKSLRQRVGQIMFGAVKHLVRYRKNPVRLGLAVLCQAAVTVVYAGCFFLCLRAVGLDLSLPETFVAFSLGAAVGSVMPTPGGLVGVEAGLLGGLIGYGLPEATALSAVLLYRLLTYWLPLVPGVAMFKLLQLRGVI